MSNIIFFFLNVNLTFYGLYEKLSETIRICKIQAFKSHFNKISFNHLNLYNTKNMKLHQSLQVTKIKVITYVTRFEVQNITKEDKTKEEHSFSSKIQSHHGSL